MLEVVIQTSPRRDLVKGEAICCRQNIGRRLPMGGGRLKGWKRTSGRASIKFLGQPISSEMLIEIINQGFKQSYCGLALKPPRKSCSKEIK